MQRRGTELLSQPCSQLVAVHHRKPDIEDRELGPELARDLERRGRIGGRSHVVANRGERIAKEQQRVLVVIDHEHATRVGGAHEDGARRLAELRRQRLGKR